jgi:hypothetical protein
MKTELIQLELKKALLHKQIIKIENEIKQLKENENG